MLGLLLFAPSEIKQKLANYLQYLLSIITGAMLFQEFLQLRESKGKRMPSKCIEVRFGQSQIDGLTPTITHFPPPWQPKTARIRGGQCVL